MITLYTRRPRALVIKVNPQDPAFAPDEHGLYIKDGAKVVAYVAHDALIAAVSEGDVTEIPEVQAKEEDD